MSADEVRAADLPLGAQQKLHEITGLLHDSESFGDVISEVEPLMLNMLGADRVTVYQRGRTDREIVSKYLGGDGLTEIRVPLTSASIAGFVALSQEAVNIQDVYDEEELKKIHEELAFSKAFDKKSGYRSQAMLVVPIKFREVLLGVLQFLNKVNGTRFTKGDLLVARALAHVLGQKFRYELRGTRSPFDYLVQKKQIKPEKLAELQERAEKEGSALSDLVLSEGGISRDMLGASLERYYQVPYMGYDTSVNIPLELLKNVNKGYLRKSGWVPVALEGETVVILIDDPTDAQRIMEIQRTLPNRQYAFRVGFMDDILRYLGQESSGGGGNVDIHELVGKLQDEVEEVDAEFIDEVDENEATVIQLVNRLIVSGVEDGASDIHIEPGKGKANANVRYRIDGVCRSSLSIPSTHIGAVVSRIKIMSALDIAERRKPQDGKCAIKYRGQPVELRVATIPTVNGESVVLRILASSEPIPIDKLNMSEYCSKEVDRLIHNPHGIFLVVGPTGSGKTTTLHSLLGHINTPDRKVWTAEDPVEITQAGLQQVQVKPSIGFDFAAAMRAFLRADPDVIMIGEMRDQETCKIAVEASLTGHLVFSTLHTNSAPETVIRLLDMGIDPVSFSDALLGVLAQRLMRTLCKECRKEKKMEESERNTLMRYYGEEHFEELGIVLGETTFYEAGGCEKCGNTGYKGRTGIHELLVADEHVRQMIFKGTSVNALRDYALSNGMRTLFQDGIRKLLRGETDFDQLRRVVAT